MLPMTFLTTPWPEDDLGSCREACPPGRQPPPDKAPQAPPPTFHSVSHPCLHPPRPPNPSNRGSRPFCSPLPSLKHESCIASKTCIQTASFPGDRVESGSLKWLPVSLEYFHHVIERCSDVNEPIFNSGSLRHLLIEC